MKPANSATNTQGSGTPGNMSLILMQPGTVRSIGDAWLVRSDSVTPILQMLESVWFYPGMLTNRAKAK